MWKFCNNCVYGHRDFCGRHSVPMTEAIHPKGRCGPYRDSWRAPPKRPSLFRRLLDRLHGLTRLR